MGIGIDRRVGREPAGIRRISAVVKTGFALDMICWSVSTLTIITRLMKSPGILSRARSSSWDGQKEIG
eukprot:scaffold51_cov401-Prasinococcus_capsulatus_cf.AAC.7